MGTGILCIYNSCIIKTGHITQNLCYSFNTTAFNFYDFLTICFTNVLTKDLFVCDK